MSEHFNRKSTFLIEIELRSKQTCSIRSIRVSEIACQSNHIRITKPSPTVISIAIFYSPTSRDAIKSICIRNSINITSSSDIVKVDNFTWIYTSYTNSAKFEVVSSIASQIRNNEWMWVCNKSLNSVVTLFNKNFPRSFSATSCPIQSNSISRNCSCNKFCWFWTCRQ